MAFIGSVGIPNCYGGFESFLEAILPVLSDKGIDVLVTCDAKRYPDKNKVFLGVQRIFINVPANGALSTWHDMVAFFKVFYHSDAIVVLGVSAGPFFLVMRLFSTLFGKKLLINIDGVEWRRKKFLKPVRLVLWMFDLLAQISATTIIYDSKALEPYVYKRFRKKAVCIAYPGDHVLRFPITTTQRIDGTALTICRIEPENNIEMLLEGALASQLHTYTMIGNWGNSAYGKEIKAKYSNHQKLMLLDPVYEPALIAQYRDSCHLYLHGHSVGGTNPSLVEMLFYNCDVLCFDCVFNRETTSNKAGYFNSKESLSALVDATLLSSLRVRGDFEVNQFTVEMIGLQYLHAAKGAVGIGFVTSEP